MIATAVDTEEVNPLTTDDTFWHRLTLAVCYQLAQSVLKIGSALAERVGWGSLWKFTSYIPHFCSCGLWQFKCYSE